MNHNKLLKIINVKDYEQCSFLNQLIFIVIERFNLGISNQNIIDYVYRSLNETILLSKKQKNIILHYIYFCLVGKNANKKLRNLLKIFVI